MIVSAALALVVAASAQVTLRGGEAPPPGPVVQVDAAAVWLGPEAPAGAGGATGDPAARSRRGLEASAAATPVLAISWDRVRAVDGEFAKAAAPFLGAAEEAWRARTRLERGDYIAAEPLFEQLFTRRYRGQTGPTAAVVAEGLLRCRIHRAAHVAAIEPWLTCLRATGTPTAPVLHSSWATEAGMSQIIDAQTGLSPGLPPMWLDWPSVDAFAKGPGIAGTPVKSGDRPTPVDVRVQAFADLYTAAAKYEVGQAVAAPELTTNDPGVGFVWQIVAARVGTPEQRDAARKALADRLKPAPASQAGGGQLAAWQEAWGHAAIGRSLVREDDPELKRLGIVELLNLPARYSAAHPYLAGLALAESSAALRGLGDQEGADVLAAEFYREYPTHPAVDWPPMRLYVPKAAPVAKPAAPANPATPAPGGAPNPDPGSPTTPAPIK